MVNEGVMPGTLGEQSRGIKVELNCAPTGHNIRGQPNEDIMGKGGSSQTGHSGTIIRMAESRTDLTFGQ